MSRSLGVTLPATVVFDYPTIAALAAYIADQLRLLRQDEPGLPLQQARPEREQWQLRLLCDRLHLLCVHVAERFAVSDSRNFDPFS